MGWKCYGFSMLLFSGFSLFLLYGIERTQRWLPWNPQKLPNVASSPSNPAPTNQALVDRVKSDVTKLQRENPGVAILADLVTASGSGLDPEISPAATVHPGFAENAPGSSPGVPSDEPF